MQDVINKYGGKIKQTFGVPVEEIQRGIKHGVRKINVDTDNRMAMTGAIRKVLAEKPEEFDLRAYMKPAREAMKEVVKARMIAFGQAGHAGGLQADSARRNGAALQGNTRHRLISVPRKGRNARISFRPVQALTILAVTIASPTCL